MRICNELKVVLQIATPLKKLLFWARLAEFFSPSRARGFLILRRFCNPDHLLIVVGTSFSQRGCNARSVLPIIIFHHPTHAATTVIHGASHLFSRQNALHLACERQIVRILPFSKVFSIVLRTVLYCSRTNLQLEAQDLNIDT